MKEARLYKKLNNNLVQCTACAWYCKISPGNLGVCCTRFNDNGKLISLVYGRPTGLALDPVEKKPMYHLFPGSTILSFGTVGCNFACLFCQNAWMSQVNKVSSVKRQVSSINEIINKYSEEITPEEIVQAAVRQNADGIAYTYNEPAIFAEFAYDIASLAKAKGLINIFVSNGYESDETFNLIKDVLDGINIDLKAASPDFYRKICKADIEPVKKNIKRFFNSGIITEVTTLLIPGYNDSDEELNQIAAFLKSISPEIPWHISAFKPSYKLLDAPPTPYETLIRADKIGKSIGLNYIYVGNINTAEHSSTYCPECHQLLVNRENYYGVINEKNFNQGICTKCQNKIYGRFY